MYTYKFTDWTPKDSTNELIELANECTELVKENIRLLNKIKNYRNSEAIQECNDLLKTLNSRGI